ncbi:GAF domain-containing protein [Deltaproteobacteria bacterium]|nr:GAF domain-containing protein [Deltaproteobacteria bacterium]
MNFRLKHKILLFYVIVCTFLLILIGTVLSSRLREEKLGTLYENIHDQLIHIDFALTGFFKQVESDLKNIVITDLVRTRDDGDFTNFLEAEESAFEYEIGETEQGIINIFNNYKESHAYVNSVYMGRENGSFVRSHKRALPTRYDPRTRPWYVLARENPGKVIKTYPYRSVTTNDVNIGIVTTLIDEQNQVYGVVGMDITLENLTKYLEDVHVGREGWIALSNEDGTIIVSRGEEALFKNIKDLGQQGLNVLLDKKEGFTTFTKNSEERYVYFYESPELRWKLAFVMPLEVIDNEISGFVNRIVLILIVSMLLLAAITLFGIQKFVITPLKKLEDHTNYIKRTGDLDKDIVLRSGDELEFLARSCNEMAASIKKTNEALVISETELKMHREHLEELVKERTNELTTINKKLKEENTLRERIEKTLKINEERLEALLELNNMKRASEEDLMTFTLEECIRLTQSRVGYLHFYNEDKKTLDLSLWSKDVLKECEWEKAQHYPLDEAGVWANCIRLRQPVIHNDYQNLLDRKGYPEGHFLVKSHMSVPVFDGDKIIAVLGVGNKEENYNESDARQVSLFMIAMWDILQRKRTADMLLQREKRLRTYYREIAGLAKRRTPAYPSLKTAFQEVTEASSKAMDVQRVSIWLCNEARSAVTCLDLFDAGSNSHFQGYELRVVDCPNYFNTLRKEGLISASNARIDQRIEEVFDMPLTPKDVTSRLDASIMLGGHIEGILCFEHVGTVREWNIEEENFARAIADFTSLNIEENHKIRAEKDLRNRMTWAEGLQEAGQVLAGCNNIKELTEIAALAPVKYLNLRMAIIKTASSNDNIASLICSNPDQEDLLSECKCPSDVLNNKKANIIPDVMTDPPYPECPVIATKGGYKSCATFPIIIEDECIAALSVRSFSKGPRAAVLQTLPLLEVFCRHVGYVWQRLLAEEKLNKAFHETAEARDQIEGILKSVADGLIVTDINNRVILMNKAAEDLLRVRFRDAVNQPIEFAIQDKTLKDRLTKTLVKGKMDYQFDFEMPAQDSDHNQIMCARTSGIQDNQGKHNGTVTIIRDVTKEREVDRMKTEFLSTAAHEVRAPLTSIQGFSEILINQNNLRKKDREKFLKYIHDQSVNLGKMINDLLDISRIESGVGTSLNRVPCNMGQIIRDIVSRFEVSSSKHSFDIDLPNESIQIKADKNKLEQILWNLLSNAMKYSPDGGTIAVTGQLSETSYQISVEDKGIGMTTKEVDRIFDKFYRANPDNKEIPGTGLGMNIVKHLVEAHRGNIRIESKIDEGTSVTFTISNS